MSKTSIFCIAKNHDQADQILHPIKHANFSSNAISCLHPDRHTMRDFAHEISTKVSKGALAGEGAGGLASCTLGGLAGADALFQTAVQALINAGSLLSVLSGTA